MSDEQEMYEMNEHDFFRVRQRLLKNAIIGLARVVNNITPIYANPLLAISDVENILTDDYGIEKKCIDEPNGWQCDMWVHFKLTDGTYLTVEGYGYYGGIKIYLTDNPQDAFYNEN